MAVRKESASFSSKEAAVSEVSCRWMMEMSATTEAPIAIVRKRSRWKKRNRDASQHGTTEVENGFKDDRRTCKSSPIHLETGSNTIISIKPPQANGCPITAPNEAGLTTHFDATRARQFLLDRWTAVMEALEDPSCDSKGYRIDSTNHVPSSHACEANVVDRPVVYVNPPLASGYKEPDMQSNPSVEEQYSDKICQ